VKLLAKAGEKLVAAKDSLSSLRYLQRSVMELYETLDEKAARELGQKLVPPSDMLQQLGQGAAVGPGGSQKLSQEKIQELLNEIAKRNPKGSTQAATPGPAAPAAPAPADPAPVAPANPAPVAPADPAPAGAP
jgi:hypothetical protein